MTDPTPTPPRPKADLSALRISRSPEPEESGFPTGKILGALAAVAILAIAAFFVYRLWIEPRSLPVVELMTVKPTINQTNIATLTASGYLVAEKQSTVTARMSGRVVRLAFEVGSQVSRGDVLAVMESSELQAQLGEARANLQEVSRDYERQRALFREGVTSRSLLDSAESQRTAAAARVQRLNVLLQDMVVRAPFDGTVISKNIELGEMVSPFVSAETASGAAGGGSIATIADLRTLEVEADVNESNLGQLREGQPAEISVDAFPGQKWRGRLRQIIPTANRAKGIVQVNVAISDPSDRLLPEMSSSVSFLQAERTVAEIQEKPKIWVPSAAVVPDSAGSHVVAVDAENRARFKRVTIGAVRDGRSEILSGLDEGDKVVTRDAAAIEDGDRVRVDAPK